jgi:hypothetical protein
MNVTGSDGLSRSVAPGETIPDFEAWPYVCRRAMLRLGRVEKLGAKEAGNLSIAGGYLHFEAEAKTPPVLPLPEAAVLSAPEPLSCSMCPRAFDTPAGLKRHIRKTHNKTNKGAT